jgi:uncharacterized membrane protein YfhO
MTIPPESDSGKPTFFYNFVELKPHSLRGPLLDLFNVKYVLFSVDDYTTQLRSDRYRLVYSNEIRIYENLDVMPRAFVVHQSKVIQDEDEIIRQMNSDSFDPRRTVILEEEDGLSKAGGPEAAASENTEITIRRYEANRVVVDATLDTSGFLVLTDSYHPGWRVKVDGRPAPLLKANYLFRAVRLEAGTHQVEFIYSPKSFRIGVFVSLGTLIAALCVLSLPRVRRGGAKS